MCFAPQWRALFRHLNFQKWSDHGVLCTFWLGNVLRATTACTFSSLTWPDGSAPAALASLLFDPPEPQIIGKTQCFATFLPFCAPGSSFFWDFLFLLLFSESSHLCFSSVHIVGSLTSKLPPIIWELFPYTTIAVHRLPSTSGIPFDIECKLLALFDLAEVTWCHWKQTLDQNMKKHFSFTHDKKMDRMMC